MYGTVDTVFENGRYYYYWGPAPVVLFAIPAHVLGLQLTETDLGIAAACALVVLACLFV